jgi:phosphate transport system protein
MEVAQSLNRGDNVPRIHFHQQLAELKDKLLAMAALAQQSVESALDAYLQRDKGLCKFVKQNERAIDTAQRELDEMAYDLLAKEQPMAIDLRFILAVIKINGDLERIGDQAMSITRRTKDVLGEQPIDLPVDFVVIGEYATHMIRSAIQALLEGDARLADSVREMDDEIDRMNRHASDNLLRLIQEKPHVSSQAMNAILISKNLERIADHASNIATDVIFWIRGADVRHQLSMSMD